MLHMAPFLLLEKTQKLQYVGLSRFPLFNEITFSQAVSPKLLLLSQINTNITTLNNYS